MTQRRGTKGNPFELGETVWVKRFNRRGVIVKVDNSDMNLPWERQYAPMRYRVQLEPGGEDIFCTVRDLEEVK